MKKLILIAGPSTAGKTTLLRAMGKAIPSGHTLIQAACREARLDDDPRFIKVYSDEDFENTTLWLKYGQFGLAQSEVDNLLSSEAEVGFCVVGVRELAQARAKAHPDLKVCTVLVRMAVDYADERTQVTQSIEKHFPDPVKRLEQNIKLLNDFFLNASFVEKHIDLVLYREKPLLHWLDAVSRRFDIRHLLADNADTLCVEALAENDLSRPLQIKQNNIKQKLKR